MLELDVLEQSPLNPLESSVSRTVTHRWPLLHVPFIHDLHTGPDPMSDLGNLDQVALQVNVHNLLPEISEDPKILPELISCARRGDTRELFIVNSAVMLDSVEKVTAMEICDPAQNVLEESGESSALQIREDFLQITITGDLTDSLHVKDHTLSDPVSNMNDDAASEQSERNVHSADYPNKDDSSGLELCDSVRQLTEAGSLAATKSSHTSIESPGFLCSEHHYYTASKIRDGNSVKCLEVEHLPCLQSTSTARTVDAGNLSEETTRFVETLNCKEPEFCCTNEVNKATSLSERLEPKTADDINAPKESVPRNKDFDYILQENGSTLSNEKQNDILVSYLSETTCAEVAASLQHIQSDTSKDDLLLYDQSVIDSTSTGNLEDDPSTKPNLPACFNTMTGAKTLDTEECSLSSTISDCNSESDCHNQYVCANKDTRTDSSSVLNVLCSAPPTIILGKPSYAKSASSSSLVEGSEISFECNSHTRLSDLNSATKEQSVMPVSPYTSLDKNVGIPGLDLNSISMETEESQCTIPEAMKLHLVEGPEKLALTQAKELYDVVPAVMNNPVISIKLVDSHSLADAEDSTLDVIHDVVNCGTIRTSRRPSDLINTIKETDDLKVPCQTVTYSTDKTLSYALVPYIDIWGSLSKLDVKLLSSLREPKNVISKNVKTRKLKKAKDELICSVKAGDLVEQPEVSMVDPQEDFSHYGRQYKDEPILDSVSKIPMVQDVESNGLAGSYSCRAECHSAKHEDRISCVPSTINHLNSSAFCATSVPLDVHKLSVLPNISDDRFADDTLQSKQTSVHFHTPCLSHSNKHLSDYSTLLPTSLPVLSESRKQKSHGKDFLGNLPLHATNHAGASVQAQDGLSKCLSLKEDTELGLKYSYTLEEPSTTSDSVQCVQISAAENINPIQCMKPSVLDEKKSPLMLQLETFMTNDRKLFTGKVDGVVTTKATRARSRRNVLNAEIKFHKKSQNDCKLLKEKPRQSAICPMEILSATSAKRKKYNLRSAPQSLNSPSMEAKRPKICIVKDAGPASSGLLNCADKFLESHHLSQPRQVCQKQQPPITRNSSGLGPNLIVKRQLNRKCKHFSTQESLPINSDTKSFKAPPVLRSHSSHNINVECKSLPSKQVDLNLTPKLQYSKRRGTVSQKPVHLQKCTQDQMLLNKLSRIANRLTTPSKASCTLKTFSSNMKVIPYRGVKIQARKLMNVFSCVSMRMNFQPEHLWQENVCLMSSRDRLVSQSMNLYPTSFPKTYFNNLDNTFSLNACNNLTFPVSFHMNIDPSCLSDFLKLNPPDFILRSPQPAAPSSELSEWTLSLFLSSHMPADTDSVHLLTQWNPQFRSLESSSESSHMRKSVIKSGCSMFGLHTVLALSSPGCYRLWTRRRNLGSRIPTVQKLSVTQFAHGLKDSSPPFSRRRDQFSSLAFSLGRILSTWSQHGLSALSSDCANSHPNCSVWLPNHSSNIISICKSPNPRICYPRLPLNAVPQSPTYCLPVQNLHHTLNPTICHLEGLRLPVSLSSQQRDGSTPLRWLSSQYKNDIELPSCSFQQVDGPKHSFTFSTVKENILHLPLHPSTLQNKLENPFGLASPKRDLKPEVNIALQKDENYTICTHTQCDVSVQEANAVDLPCPELSPKSLACPFEQRENIIIACTQSQNKDQGNEKGSFERKPQRVSQIRIRKTIPKPDPNLTPMGLPKPKRVNKKEFSLEDIYTNKNYKSPPPARSLETIFEEPKEKNGILISVSQQKRKRILEFRDCTVPRLKRPKGKMKVMTSCKRGRKAAMEGVQLDTLLIQKLMDLENCLLEEEAMERISTASEMPS